MSHPVGFHFGLLVLSKGLRSRVSAFNVTKTESSGKTLSISTCSKLLSASDAECFVKMPRSWCLAKIIVI